MFIKDLESLWNGGKFAPSWILGTQNPELTLTTLMNFVEKIMDVPGVPIENNPDFRIVRRESSASSDHLTKHITVDQIRDLQKFFSETNSISPYKIAIIYEADTMNVNASNCCLKILEDTQKNSFIFLITSLPSNILTTIRSRCSIVHSSGQTESIDQSIYHDALEIISNNKTFLAKLSGKIEKDFFQNFGMSLLYLLGKLIKKQKLTIEEETYVNMGRNLSTELMLHKFDKIKKIIDEAKNFDLDIRAAFILLVEEINK